VFAKVLAGLGLATVALLTAGAGPRGSAPAAAQTVNHAAIVVDTGDGQVRKMCLTFSEAELDGIEALRRVDTRPYRFETFGTKGAAVCMLCGVGCPSGDCFCDPSKFWAYHRAGPGETEYQASRVGAGATKVRDGDVEAWKWGTGGAPEKVSVSQVCNVPEPPARTAGATTTTSTTTEGSEPPTSAPTTLRPEASPATTTATPPAPVTAKPGSPTTTAPATTTTAGEVPGGIGAEETGPETAAAHSEPPVDRSIDAGNGSAAGQAQKAPRSGGTSRIGLAAFGAAMAGLLVWRTRLRRAKVRPVRPVR
jgi:hypothetical protein